jgi:methylthioxylose transferase
VTVVQVEAPKRHRPGLTADVVAAFLVLALVAAANLVITWGHWYTFLRIYDWAPPLFGDWHPHVGPGTPVALVVGLAVVLRGPELAVRLSWRRLLFLAYSTGIVWTVAVHLVDGWQRGVPDRLSTNDEYLVDVPGITDIPAFLRGFTSHILSGRPDSWVVHVSGHPPAATLSFVWLARIGLGGPVPAALLVVLVGGLAVVAVPVTLRALGAERAARAATPFLAVFPGAAIAGVSADWLFAGVSSTGVALLALGAVRLRVRWSMAAALVCLISGVVLGWCLFLSYGLVAFALVPLTVIVLARSPRALMLAVVAAAVVVAGFALAGFWWLDGYHLVVWRYDQDVGRTRPDDYWVWANLAALVLSTGPVVAAGLRRAVLRGAVALKLRTFDWRLAVPALACAAALVVVAADASGLSKAETERIWLPFAVWLAASTALIPARHRRWWLAAQVMVALVVRHLLWVQW